MDQFTDAVRAFFDRLNQFWITRDTTALARSAGREENDTLMQRWLHRVQHKQRELRRRHSRLLRTHTKVVIVQMEPGGGNIVHLIVDEHVTWVYRDGRDYGVESRVVRHWQKWVAESGIWTIVEDGTSEEQMPRTSDAALVQSDGDVADASGVWGDTLRATCTVYDRVRAQRYAELWWNGFNPNFVKFLDDDCTNFISQCMLSGGVRMTGGQSRATGWWYRFGDASGQAQWSFSWSVANALHQYLVGAGGAKGVSSARELKVGDLIMYDWGGSGRYGHSTMVVDFDGNGDPLVNAHTEPSYHRHYLYLDSPAWTQKTRYAYLHLPDEIC